jgi:HAD superfamily hydrolase (TIGR01509 family)
VTALLRRADAVIFDVDDTLVATGAAWQHAVNVTCARAAAAGACPDPGQLAASYQSVSDALWSDYPRALAPLGTVTAIRRHVWAQALRACGAALPAQRLDQLAADFAAAQLAAIRPDPVLAGLLALLGRRRLVAACTNGDRSQTRAKLGRAGLLPAFPVITCGMDEQVRKPDPELLRRCCRALGVAPGRCLHVGDDWRNDVDAARRAGLHPVWISPGQQAAPPGPPPLARYGTAAECLRALLQPETACPRPGRAAGERT